MGEKDLMVGWISLNGIIGVGQVGRLVESADYTTVVTVDMDGESGGKNE